MYLKTTVITITMLLAGCATTATTETAAPATAEKATVAAPVQTAAAAYTEFSKINWVAGPKGDQGPSMSPIHGDPKTGPVSFIFKMPAGHTSGLHSHPAAFAGAVVSGTVVHGKTEAEAVTLATGSTWTQDPNQAHYTACTKDAECVVVGHFDGPFGTVAADKAHEGELGSVMTTAEKAVFKPLNPKMPNGPQMLVLSGDHTKEAFRALVKVPVGFKTPMHMHASNYAGAAVVGAMQKNGGAKLVPGSIWTQTMNEAHMNACLSDKPCIFFIAMDGAFSMTPAKAVQ
jgi:anti-sigma factor ChrR (cupin superfamily)